MKEMRFKWGIEYENEWQDITRTLRTICWCCWWFITHFTLLVLYWLKYLQMKTTIKLIISNQRKRQNTQRSREIGQIKRDKERVPRTLVLLQLLLTVEVSKREAKKGFHFIQLHHSYLASPSTLSSSSLFNSITRDVEHWLIYICIYN